MTIGIFDSGIGGEAVAAALAKEFPEAKIVIVNDSKNVPYGGRSAKEVFYLTNIAVQPLLKARVDVLVIACNTATTLALPKLRQLYPDQLFIGIEPMIKPAAKATKTGIIGVCATPATLASQRYNLLKTTLDNNTKIIEPDCSTWATMIEHGQINESLIKQQINNLLDQGVDAIVLGCTHYHWIRDLIEKETSGKATVLEPSSAIGRRVRKLLNLI